MKNAIDKIQRQARQALLLPHGQAAAGSEYDTGERFLLRLLFVDTVRTSAKL
jgi:hypothetical protein